MSINKEKYAREFNNKLASINAMHSLASPLELEELWQEHLDNVPKYLYKFRTCNKMNLSSIENNQIWLAKPDEFTDTYDSDINIDMRKIDKNLEKWFRANIVEIMFYSSENHFNTIDAKHLIKIEKLYELFDMCMDNESKTFQLVNLDILNEQGLDYMQYKRVLQKIEYYLSTDNVKNIVKNFSGAVLSEMKKWQKKLQVYSLTESYKNVAMWENYANRYKGFCIEYDIHKIDINSKKKMIYLMPMIYKQKLPNFDLGNFLEKTMEMCMLGHGFDINKDLLSNELELNLQFLYKNKDYKYEKEWRIITKNIKNSLQDFPYVTAIYMGRCISEKNEIELTRIAKKLGIKLYKQYKPEIGINYEYKKIEC